MDANEPGAEIGRFRALVLADPTLQDVLGAYQTAGEFVPAAIALAHSRSIEISPETMLAATRPDPIGLSRWSFAGPTGLVPQKGWLPVAVRSAPGGPIVDWAFFGDRALREPFYEGSVRRALDRPLNRLARHCTPLSALVADASGALRPSGFIFHMSRCGSTLVSQMLAADPRNLVISEAAPLDAVIRLNAAGGDAHVTSFQAMVAALGRRRGPEERLFVKLDSWHALLLPLFRRAFPDVPWVFLYREPAAVLASQMTQRGIQTLPGYLPPALSDLTADDGEDPDAYCAKLLRATCGAVIRPFGEGGGLLVNYNELPAALWTRILPHFGVETRDAERARMAEAAQFDAKNPSFRFVGSSWSREDASAGEALADRYLHPVYGALEALRLGGQGA